MFGDDEVWALELAASVVERDCPVEVVCIVEIRCERGGDGREHDGKSGSEGDG